MSKKLLFNFNREVIQNYTYVKYVGTIITATNTLEKPIKSAILKGNTLKKAVNNLFNGDVEDGHYDVNTGEKAYYANRKRCADKIKINPSTTYTLSGITWFLQYDENGNYLGHIGTNDKRFVFTSKDNAHFLTFYNIYNESDFFVGLGNVEPLYELVSIKLPVLKTTGKNKWKTDSLNPIFDVGLLNVETNDCTIKMTNIGNTWRGITIDSPLKGEGVISFNVNISLINDSTKQIRVSADGVHLGRLDATRGRVNIKIPQGAKTISLKVLSPANTNVDFEIYDIQLEEGSVATSYEPYKTNILMVSEEVELRGIGNVKDELNLLTGELTQRTNTITFDGADNEKWSESGLDIVGYKTFKITGAFDNNGSGVMTNNFTTTDYANLSGKQYEFCARRYSELHIRISTDKISEASVDGFKEYLSKNRLVAIGGVRTPTIKTVDLSILDQNGNKVSSISSFNDTTHIMASSETIPPTFEGYLATKEVE